MINGFELQNFVKSLHDSHFLMIKVVLVLFKFLDEYIDRGIQIILRIILYHNLLMIYPNLNDYKRF